MLREPTPPFSHSWNPQQVLLRLASLGDEGNESIKCSVLCGHCLMDAAISESKLRVLEDLLLTFGWLQLPAAGVSLSSLASLN